MVLRRRKKYLLLLIAVLALCMSMSVTASASNFQVYDGSLSSTYINYFKDILAKDFALNDYVAFRCGQYSYIMAVGDISYSNNFFSGDSVTLYTISSDGGYNSYYSLTTSQDSAFSLSCNNNIVYSNLGHYPSLVDRGDIGIYALLSLLAVVCVFILITRIFNAHKR